MVIVGEEVGVDLEADDLGLPRLERKPLETLEFFHRTGRGRINVMDVQLHDLDTRTRSAIGHHYGSRDGPVFRHRSLRKGNIPVSKGRIAQAVAKRIERSVDDILII